MRLFVVVISLLLRWGLRYALPLLFLFFGMIFRVHFSVYMFIILSRCGFGSHKRSFFQRMKTKAAKNRFLFISHWFVSVFMHPSIWQCKTQAQLDSVIFTCDSWWVNSVKTWHPSCNQITFRHFTRTVVSQFMVRLVLVLHSFHSYIWQRPLTDPNSLSLIFMHAINHLKPPIHQQIKHFTINIPRARSCQLAHRSYLIESQSLTPN